MKTISKIHLPATHSVQQSVSMRGAAYCLALTVQDSFVFCFKMDENLFHFYPGALIYLHRNIWPRHRARVFSKSQFAPERIGTAYHSHVHSWAGLTMYNPVCVLQCPHAATCRTSALRRRRARHSTTTTRGEGKQQQGGAINFAFHVSQRTPGPPLPCPAVWHDTFI